MPTTRRGRTVLSVATTDPARVTGGRLGLSQLFARGWDLRWWPDVFPALLVALLQVGGTAAASHRQPERWSLNALGVALLLAGPVALLVRRRWPEVSLAVAFSAALAYWLTDYPRGPAGFPALIVALVSAVLAGRRAFAWGTLAVGYLGFTVLPPLLGQESWDVGRALGLAAWLLVLGTGAEIIPQPPRAAGGGWPTSRPRSAAAPARSACSSPASSTTSWPTTSRSSTCRPASRCTSSTSSPTRPAPPRRHQGRQQGGARRAAVGAGRAAAERGRDRRTPGPDRRPPRPAGARGAHRKLDVTLDVSGLARPVPAGVDLAAFRIAQEALTNVVRHADAGSAGAARLRRRAPHGAGRRRRDPGAPVPSATAAGGESPV